MISNRPEKNRLLKELREAIVELEWPGNHARRLPFKEVIHRLRNSIERQRALRAIFATNHTSPLEESGLDEELRALCSAQRHGLFQLIRRFRVCGVVDCKSRMGKGMDISNAHRARSSMEPSSS